LFDIRYSFSSSASEHGTPLSTNFGSASAS